MAKKPGLQGGFELQVDQDAFGGPAHLDDYLDRTLTPPVPTAPPVKPRVKPATPPVQLEAPPAPPQEKVVDLDAARRAKPVRRTKPRRAERRELSIDPECQRMIDRQVDDLREKTPQKDASASEFIRAVVQLADESRHHQDFSHVARRGQWGSPTARAFVLDVKKAFLRAIGRNFIQTHPQEALEFYREFHEGQESELPAPE